MRPVLDVRVDGQWDEIEHLLDQPNEFHDRFTLAVTKEHVLPQEFGVEILNDEQLLGLSKKMIFAEVIRLVDEKAIGRERDDEQKDLQQCRVAFQASDDRRGLSECLWIVEGGEGVHVGRVFEQARFTEDKLTGETRNAVEISLVETLLFDERERLEFTRALHVRLQRCVERDDQMRHGVLCELQT